MEREGGAGEGAPAQLFADPLTPAAPAFRFAELRLLGQVLAKFTAQHPAISLELDLSPRRVDLIGENFDLALRVGDLPDDASLAARRLAQ